MLLYSNSFCVTGICMNARIQDLTVSGFIVEADWLFMYLVAKNIAAKVED